MRFSRSLALVGFLTVLAGLATAAQYAPPPSQAPDSATRKAIEERIGKLEQVLEQLRRQGAADPFLADVEVCHKAAVWILRQEEFYQKAATDWTLTVLDRGLLRASQQARGEAPWMNQVGFSVAHAYRSRVDGSVQPYAVTFPADYGKDPNKRWRLDVVLHGRDPSLTEVAFLHRHGGDKAAPSGQDFVQLDVYGRGNNGYRWAGESDVQEALENFLAVERLFRREGLLDPARFVLRGFSMGGAGTWHLGLHRPDRWCVLGPGAGFTTTHGYVQDLPEKLPPEQEACLRIYDAADYAENAFDVPVVAYAGAEDPQLQAARNVQERLQPLHIPMTLLIAPEVAHQFPPEWQKKAEQEYAKHTAKGRPEYPRKVHFVTYTLKYPFCEWVSLIALDRHYEKAVVDAEQTEDGFTIRTANVRALDVRLGPGSNRQQHVLQVDGQRLEGVPYQKPDNVLSLHYYLEKREGRWALALPEKLVTERLRRPQKMPGLQGPLDDAFMGSFLCVRGTGKAWHESTQAYAEANLQRFREEWSRFFRGDLPVKADAEVTPQDLAGRHLVLFGDPGSNSLIDQALTGLPLKWTRERITWQGKEYDAAEHVPVLVYPSPLSPDRYVVLNSGHTFRAADFLGSNALLFPRLGDQALLKLGRDAKDPLAVEVVRAGLFDDYWHWPSLP